MQKNILIFIVSLFISTYMLQAIDTHQIPKSLQDWTAWVLDDIKDKNCPINFSKDEHICSYPTHINVYLQHNSLTFKMKVTAFKDRQKINLPHAYQNWVKDVRVDGEKVAVLGSANAMVFLEKGDHTIEGNFLWKKIPKYLHLPANVALVTLFKNGEKVLNPKVDTEFRLWLNQIQKNHVEKGTLSVSIYRKLIDGHPMKMQTHLHFRISGKMRSVLLDGIVLEGFHPSKISGNIDARITKDKKLEVQVKAGEWNLTIDSFSPTNLSEFHAPKHTFKYTNQETLSLQTDASYRTIEIENAQTIDPSQNNVPKAWKHLALYLLEAKKSLKIKELYKSVKQQQQNDFILNREIWLDYDGKGYSIKDHIQADISYVKRLESLGTLALGSVSINKKPMLINTLKNSQQKGVELREKSMKIEASSRYDKDISLLPANGWSEEFNQVSTHLNLPPGWKVFASFGSDSQSSMSWIKKWNLMDIFLVLFLSIAIFQLFGLKWSIPATFFLILLWHEEGAPTIIWLWILALVALIKVLTEGKIKKTLQVIFALSSVVVILNVLQFSVYKVRTTLYPQLEKVSSYTPQYKGINKNVFGESRGAILGSNDNTVLKSSKVKEAELQSSNYVLRKSILKPKKKQVLLQNKIDPNAIVQTGEGTPTWSWSHHSFFWQSTVGTGDTLKIWFITPFMTKILNILNIIGMLFLLWMFLQAFLNISIKNLKDKLFAKQNILMILFSSIIIATPQYTQASDIPSTVLLQTLKDKLLEPPACLPHCASIEQMEIRIKEDQLFIHMNISAGVAVSVPILGNRNIWLPEAVEINDSNKSYLQVDKEGSLWVMLPQGIHKVTMYGTIQGTNQMMLSSKLPIHNLHIQKNNLWKINSDYKSYIELINLDKKASTTREKTKSAIEPMVQIKRTFYFGLRWYIETEVKLLNDIDKPYTLHYNLLDTESILNKDIEVNGKQAILHLHNTKQTHTWRSSLAISPQISLKASNKNTITEIWKMDISSMWNMHYKGVESDKQVTDKNLLMPTFRPWKDETLTLNLDPIKAVRGKSLTIESSNLDIRQSQRYRDLTLTLNIQSSHAQPYTIKLENVKELSSVKIDNLDYYLKINNDQLTLPLKGKSQNIIIKWKEESGTQTIYNFSNIHLNKDAVNSNINLILPQNRWILWTNGPILGPAVLLWGVLLSILIFAFILGRIKNTPLKVRDWLLLGIGVSTSSIMSMVPIVIWIFLLRYKESKADELKGTMRNFIQIMIVIFTFIALITLIIAISIGLLGNPDMMIQGNNSYGFNLHWYSDKIENLLPQPTVISVSMWYYRALMLLWSIWISFSLIKWLKWSWHIFSKGDMWAKKVKIKKES